MTSQINNQELEEKARESLKTAPLRTRCVINLAVFLIACSDWLSYSNHSSIRELYKAAKARSIDEHVKEGVRKFRQQELEDSLRGYTHRRS